MEGSFRNVGKGKDPKEDTFSITQNMKDTTCMFEMLT